MRSFFKGIWSSIKTFSKKVAYVQSVIILTLFYFIIIGLFSIVIRLLGRDLLNKKWKDKKTSYPMDLQLDPFWTNSDWIKKEKVELNLENARRQF